MEIQVVDNHIVRVDYWEDLKKDPKYGTFGAELTYDYLKKAQDLVVAKYGNDVEVLQALPVLIVRIP